MAFTLPCPERFAVSVIGFSKLENCPGESVISEAESCPKLAMKWTGTSSETAISSSFWPSAATETFAFQIRSTALP
jgi:hypothetical protein